MIVQRLRQGLRALFAFAQPVDLALSAKYLTPEQLALFQQMRRGEQLHSLHVLRDVLAQSSTPSELAVPTELAVAALLHDVGKRRYPLRLWQKTAAVLVRAFAPAHFERLSHGDPRRALERPFVVYVQHPAWSAELLAQTGASEAAVWLVAHHADDPDSLPDCDLIPLLKRLQQADDAN